ncbi:MAG: SDR family oxidoreductase [Alphaproteobacteria bacterium]|nr:SDR family oxidoreductase [Alphaproteobacteria bacterium]
METGLSGKRAIVTAGANGIGRAISETLMAAGARVHICDVDEAQIAAARAALPGLGATLADVSDVAAVDRLFDEALDAMGGLDILVNNAGIAGPVAPVDEIDPEDWRRCIAVDLDGPFLCARRAVPAIREAGGGSIVNISSTAGLFGFPNRSPYAAAKWGVIGFTKTLAMELGPNGIRVNAICPGSVSGPRIDAVIAGAAKADGITEEAMRNIWLRQVSMRTFVEAQDIANMVLFICSDAGAKISGQALSVDGHTESLSA